MTQRRNGLLLLAGSAMAMSSAIAAAGVSDPILSFEASSALGTGTITFDKSDALGLDLNGDFVDDLFIFTLGAPVNIMDGGNTIGQIGSGSITIGFNPLVNQHIIGMTWEVTAGAADTVFEISSGLASFANISSAQALATAGYGLVDSAGSASGATLTGLEPGGNLYRTQYNGLLPGGTEFAGLLTGPFNAVLGSPDEGAAASAGTPDTPAFTGIGSVSDMSARWSFELSADDQANGTSNYVIVPTPATIGLLALGGLTATRRRR